MRLPRSLLAAGVALASLASIPAAAHAATVSVDSGVEEEGELVSYSLLAEAGEANRVTVTTRPVQRGRRVVVFRDAGAPLVPGHGCAAEAGGAVVCRHRLGDFANSVDLILGDGDDSADASRVGLRGFTVFADGGTGSDALTGSRTLRNALFGDFVSAEVGADRLIGGRGGDYLRGGRGDDVIEGRGGADRLIGGPGLDRFLAGPGGDRVRSADGGAERVACGRGTDRVLADAGDMPVGCEAVRRAGRA